MKNRILVFTDLDGTLLDHTTYSFRGALPAIKMLRQRKIPVIICTSKTRAEVEVVRLALRNSDPFIVENGGAVFLPDGYFPGEIPAARKDSAYRVIELGTPYPTLVDAFSRIKSRLPGKARGFADLSIKEVAGLTGLSRREAALAKKREYDEPFLVEDPSLISTIQRMAAASGLKITRGGRFFHLTGDNDKGRAVRRLQALYARTAGGPLRSIGLGDSQNDLPLLEAVDFPVLVKKPGGQYDSAVRVPNLILAPGVGPAGWRAAVLELVGRYGG
jgi:mannosyl-3-phosphoglycerate phosphatase